MNALPYIFLSLLCFFFHYYGNSQIILKKTCDVGIFIILIVFFSFRGYVFTDYLSYKPWFENYLNDVFITVSNHTYPWFEPGFVLYSSIIKTFTENYLIYQMVDGFIDVILLYACLNYFHATRPLNIMVFLAMSGMIMFFDTLRNIKSILIFFYSIRYINEKKILKYYICCFLALAFHTSSIIYFICYPILKMTVTRERFVFVCLLCFLIGLFSSLFIRIFFMALNPFLPEKIMGLVKIYVFSSSGYSKARFISFGVIEKILTFLLILTNYNSLSKDKNSGLLVKIFILYFCSYFLLSGLKEISNRISMLFIFNYWILIPKIILIQKPKKQVIYAICILCYCILKMGLYNKPLQVYENWAFGPISSFEERKFIVGQWNGE